MKFVYENALNPLGNTVVKAKSSEKKRCWLSYFVFFAPKILL